MPRYTLSSLLKRLVGSTLVWWLLLMVPGTSVAADCPSGNLLAGMVPETEAELVSPERLTDELGAAEGAPWDDSAAVVLRRGTRLVWHLPGLVSVHGLQLQADDNDRYLVEGSTDGETWIPLWTAPLGRGPGLRTRAQDGLQADVRLLRLRALQGDDFRSVSELRAWCEVGNNWPPPLTRSWIPSLDREQRLALYKIAYGLVAGLLLLGLRRRYAGWSQAARAAAAAATVATSFFVWTNGWTFHGPRVVHTHDAFHYVLGARYFEELGFDGLYDCVLRAEAADPALAEGAARRRLRVLSDNHVARGRDRLRAQACGERFDPRRWEAFQSDAAAFWSLLGSDGWRRALLDHGYNASPAWTAAAGLWLDEEPVDEALLGDLARLDAVAYGLTFAALAWGFGGPAAMLASVVWAVGFPWAWYWTGGSFARAFWLAALALGLALLQRGHRTTGAAAVLTAGLLRAFPVLFLLPGMLVLAHRGLQQRLIPEAGLRLLTGALAACLILVPPVTALTGGPGVWGAFLHNTAIHAATPLTNHMGLAPVIAWSPSTAARELKQPGADDPYATWKEARRRTQGSRGLLWALAGLFLVERALRAASALTGEGLRAATGVILVLATLQLTSYDLVVFVLLAPLATGHAAAGAVLLGTAMATQVPQLLTGWTDEQHVLASAILIGGSLAVVEMARTRARAAPASS